jgi:hypothetical protein
MFELIALDLNARHIKITSFLGGVILVYTHGLTTVSYALKRTHRLTPVVYLVNKKTPEKVFF